MKKQTLVLDDFSLGLQSVHRINTPVAPAGSAQTLLNFFPHKDGQLIRRFGTRAFAISKNATPPRLLYYCCGYAAAQRVLVELGAGYARFYAIDSGALINEVATPFPTTIDLFSICVVPIENRLFLFHVSTTPHFFSYDSSRSVYSITKWAWYGGPYMLGNTDPMKKMWAERDPIITAMTSYINSDFDIFTSGDMGRWVSVYCVDSATQKGYWGEGYITQIVNARKVKIYEVTYFYTTVKNHIWRLGAYSDGLGWPALACFFGNRLWLASVAEFGILYVSNILNYARFTPAEGTPQLPIDGITTSGFRLRFMDSMIRFQQMFSMDRLFIATDSRLYEVHSINGEELTPFTIAITPVLTFASKQIIDSFVVADHDIIYAHKNLPQLRRLSFSVPLGPLTQDTVFMDTFLDGGDDVSHRPFTSLSLLPGDWAMLWMTMSDGRVLTVDLKTRAVAVHHFYAPVRSCFAFESAGVPMVCFVLQNPHSPSSCSIEIIRDFQSFFTLSWRDRLCAFLDGAPDKPITTNRLVIPHLNGQRISVVDGDGVRFADVIDSVADITITNGYYGVPYTSVWHSHPLLSDYRDMALSRFVSLDALLFKSYSGSVVVMGGHTVVYPLTATATLEDTPLLSLIHITVDTGWSEYPQLQLSTDAPYGFHLSCLKISYV